MFNIFPFNNSINLLLPFGLYLTVLSYFSASSLLQCVLVVKILKTL